MIAVKRVQAGCSTFFDNDRAPGYWIVLLGIPALLALGAALLVPFSAPMPVYLQDARQYVATGAITDTTFPLEFAWLTGLSIQALGSRGPEVLQAVFYLLTVLSVWALARKCGASARYALIAALGAAVYPQLPVSVTKGWDVELAVLLMVLLMLLTVCLMRAGLRPSLVLALGVVFGLSLAQRSNMLLLFPLPVWFCFASAATWPRKLLAFVLAAVLAVLTLVTVNTLAHGSFFLPQNGPYNLVQGHNEFSIQVMLHDLTCEPSVALFMKADGINPDGFNEADPKLQHYFTHRALTYMRSHPLQEAEITAVKLWTFFRPNTRIHHGMSLMTALVLCMSLIFPAWVVLLLRRKARTGLDALDWTFIAAAALYVLPFLITASDPRYQIPLEICLLAHMAYMAGFQSCLAAQST
jgi:4-amino-4-deoxy-L-arabinose transferase-like glycosyltransferase